MEGLHRLLPWREGFADEGTSRPCTTQRLAHAHRTNGTIWHAVATRQLARFRTQHSNRAQT